MRNILTKYSWTVVVVVDIKQLQTFDDDANFKVFQVAKCLLLYVCVNIDGTTVLLYNTRCCGSTIVNLRATAAFKTAFS